MSEGRSVRGGVEKKRQRGSRREGARVELSSGVGRGRERVVVASVRTPVVGSVISTVRTGGRRIE
jgi:hypothetical protein